VPCRSSRQGIPERTATPARSTGRPLRRRATITLALLVAVSLALAPSAAASRKRLSGTVEPAGTIGFKLVKSRGRTRATDIHFEGVPILCDNESGTTFGRLSFPVDVSKKGKFHVVAQHKGRGNPEGSTLKIRAQLTRNRRHAFGSLRVFGSAPTNSGVGLNCHTGKRSWTAARS
jgi:hypothetical protein